MTSPSRKRKLRDPADDATAAAPPSTDATAGKCGIVRVELAKSGRGHCGWCDTLIAAKTPRVVKRQYHAPGAFIRNNGASRGYNRGGVMDLFLHPQCAWTAMAVGVTKKSSIGSASCSSCNLDLPAGSWHFATRLGKEDSRCVESGSGKLWQCVPCVTGFVRKHRSLLDGYVGEKSQFDEPVAWLKQPAKGQRTLFGAPVSGRRPEAPDRKSREQMRAVFRGSDEEGGEVKAVERHRKLQAAISAALQEDKARGGKLSAKAS